jgi:butyrate kinase
MFDIEGSFDRQILSFGKIRPTVVFPEALDPRVIEAVCHLARFVRPVFLASEAQAREVVARDLRHVDPDRVDYLLSESTFVDIPARTDLVEEFARAQFEFCQQMGSPVPLERAQQMIMEPARFGIWSVRLDHADTVVAGARHAPKDYFRPMLRLLAKQQIQCEAGIFVLPADAALDTFPHDIVVFGDVGVNATMTPEVLASVAVGTCVVARDLIPEDVLPDIRGVIVSYSNRGSDEGPSPELVRKAMALIPDVLAERVDKGERYRTISIQGEVKVSVALSQRSAMYHSADHEARWAGGPNVIICPNLEMGNLLYHLYAARFPEAKKFPAMFGLRFRGVDLPMDCTPEDIRLAIKASVLRMYRFGEWKRTPRDTFFHRHRVLAVNPGSTSTKIGVFEGEEERFTVELQHTAEELLPFEGKGITEQYAFRKEIITRALADHGLNLADLDAVAARGGMLHAVPHGTLAVSDDMVSDLRAARYGEHASNLGALIARELTADLAKPAFIVDPVVVDEAQERVRVTGMKAIRRKVISHALNQIATARRYAEERETFYEKVNVIVCHLGGGITVGAHKHGRYIDVNNGLDGEGPFSPQRSGGMPTGQMIELCFSGRYTKPELKLLNKGRGGLIDLLGTADLREVERRIDAGDREAARVYEAMTYRIAKEIASLVPAFDGEPVDRVLLTGGMARSPRLVGDLSRLLAAMGCGLSVYPGENELSALVKGALRVLDGKEEARQYLAEPRPPAPPPVAGEGG